MMIFPLFIFIIKTSITTNEFLSNIRDIVEQDGKERYHQYVAVFDGGTTGTRLNIFGFLMPDRILDYFTIEKVEPGIHELEDLSEIESILTELIVNADTKLEQFGLTLSEIPVVFDATAGMRLLNIRKKLRILDAIKRVFIKNDIFFDEISVISGFLEGKLALDSINYLKNFNFNVIKKFGCQDSILSQKLITKYKNFCDSDVSKNDELKYIGVMDMGGGSLQIAYEFEKTDDYSDPIHVIETLNKKIYINSFDGWGLMDAMMVFKANKLYNLQEDSKKSNVFSELMKDFEIPEKPDMNHLDSIFLLSYFYINFTELGCENITNLDEINTLFKEKCDEKTSEFCNEIFYMKSFIETQGIKSDKILYLAHDIAGINVNWSLSRALYMI